MTEEFTEPGSLMEKTLKLLEGEDQLKLYRATGIPFPWLQKLTRGEIKNPSVNRIQFLYEYLTQKNLEV